MGLVVNKSFNKVRKDIARKSDKLLKYIENNSVIINNDVWNLKQDKVFLKLSQLCYSLADEFNNLEEVPPPDFNK